MSTITAHTHHADFAAESHGTVLTAVRAFLTRVHKFLTDDGFERDRASREAYLAESTDRYDLELRMRELDRPQAQSYWMTGLNG